MHAYIPRARTTAHRRAYSEGPSTAKAKCNSYGFSDCDPHRILWLSQCVRRQSVQNFVYFLFMIHF